MMADDDTISGIIESKLKELYPDRSTFELRTAADLYLKDDYTPELTDGFKEPLKLVWSKGVDSFLKKQSYHLEKKSPSTWFYLQPNFTLLSFVYTRAAKDNVAKQVIDLMRLEWLPEYCKEHGYQESLFVFSCEPTNRLIRVEFEFDRAGAICVFYDSAAGNRSAVADTTTTIGASVCNLLKDL